MKKDRVIMFDWAAKSILRDKANFGVIEGLLQVLLGQEIHIVDMLESEGNQKNERDKFNRVDIKAKDSHGEIIIVEIQLTRQMYFMERILYGVAKSITEHINLGDSYSEIKKVYSISILYFDLGKGEDYLYHGQTVFTGVNTHDELKISDEERHALELKTPADVFPEYYIVRVNKFVGEPKTHLEEWLKYLRIGEISENTTAPGLREAREKMRVMTMSDKELAQYEYHLDIVMSQNDAFEASRREGLYTGRLEGMKKGFKEGHEEGLKQGRAQGHEEGLKQGREQGRAQGHEEGLKQGREQGHEEGLKQGREQGREEGHEEGLKQGVVNVARKLLSEGADLEFVSRCTGLSVEEVGALGPR